jgi:hypothetical protein
MEVVDHDRRPAGSFAASLTIAAAVVPDHHQGVRTQAQPPGTLTAQ